MADAQPGRVQQLLSSDDELLIHVVYQVPADSFLENVGSMSSNRWCFINLNSRIV
jgi:hypothetical protein